MGAALSTVMAFARSLTVPLVVHRWTDPLQQQPEFPDVIEWHPDERRFVDVVLKTIAGTVTTQQPGGAKRAGQGEGRVGFDLG